VTTLEALQGRAALLLHAGFEGLMAGLRSTRASELFGQVNSGQARHGMAGAEPITVGYIRYQ
jgi:hypothetical protein